MSAPSGPMAIRGEEAGKQRSGNATSASGFRFAHPGYLLLAGWNDGIRTHVPRVTVRCPTTRRHDSSYTRNTDQNEPATHLCSRTRSKVILRAPNQALLQSVALANDGA